MAANLGVRGPSRRRANSEINVTPFVDVMLVLLIIFLVTAPLMQQGMDVDLPETTTQPLRVRDDPLILTVEKSGTFHLGRKEVPLEELVTKLEAVFEARGSKEIFLRADKDVPYGFVMSVLDALRREGVDSATLVVQPLPEEDGGA